MKKFLKDAKGHIMSGIGYMLPLIIGASLVVAIPKLIGVAMGINSLDAYATKDGFLHILYLLEQVGWTGIGLVNTVLAGFIAFSIADKPAIGAGLIGGALASNTKAGFLGAVIAAFIAGYIVKWGKEHIKLPDSMQQMMPLVILPFLATGAVAIIMGFIGITEGAIPFTLVKASRLIPINMIGGALGAGICCLLGATADIPPVGGMYGFVSITGGWAYLVGIIVGALFIAIVAPMVVDFNDDKDEEETISVDDIEIVIE